MCVFVCVRVCTYILGTATIPELNVVSSLYCKRHPNAYVASLPFWYLCPSLWVPMARLWVPMANPLGAYVPLLGTYIPPLDSYVSPLNKNKNKNKNKNSN